MACNEMKHRCSEYPHLTYKQGSTMTYEKSPDYQHSGVRSAPHSARENEMNQLSNAIIQAAKLLGNGDASTPYGAIEAHSMAIKDSGILCSDALDNIAEQLSRIATVLEDQGKQDD